VPIGISARQLKEPGLFGLKQRFVEPGLTDDALEGAAVQGIVEGHRDSDCGPFCLQLHDAVATALAHGDESVGLKNLAGFSA